MFRHQHDSTSIISSSSTPESLSPRSTVVTGSSQVFTTLPFDDVISSSLAKPLCWRDISKSDVSNTSYNEESRRVKLSTSSASFLALHSNELTSVVIARPKHSGITRTSASDFRLLPRDIGESGDIWLLVMRRDARGQTDDRDPAPVCALVRDRRLVRMCSWSTNDLGQIRHF